MVFLGFPMVFLGFPMVFLGFSHGLYQQISLRAPGHHLSRFWRRCARVASKVTRWFCCRAARSSASTTRSRVGSRDHRLHHELWYEIMVNVNPGLINP